MALVAACESRPVECATLPSDRIVRRHHVMPATPGSAPRSSPLALTVLALLHYQPLHPYGIQRLIKQWGKDQVVNVEQRTSLYRTIERLLAAGLIAVRETGRDPR